MKYPAVNVSHSLAEAVGLVLVSSNWVGTSGTWQNGPKRANKAGVQPKGQISTKQKVPQLEVVGERKTLGELEAELQRAKAKYFKGPANQEQEKTLRAKIDQAEKDLKLLMQENSQLKERVKSLAAFVEISKEKLDKALSEAGVPEDYWASTTQVVVQFQKQPLIWLEDLRQGKLTGKVLEYFQLAMKKLLEDTGDLLEEIVQGSRTARTQPKQDAV